MPPIVAAVDFSAGSERAAALAARLAAARGAPLHLLTADVLYRASGDGAPADVPSGPARLRLERLAERLGVAEATVVVERHTSASGAILDYVADVGAGLLVMGSHGRSGLPRLLLGSVAEACVAGAPCPVLTLPDRAADAPPGAPVLVAVDFSPRSEVALAAGRALAAWTGGSVELVHVVRDGDLYEVRALKGGPLADTDAAAAEAVERRLRRFAVDGGVEAVHALVGAPGRAIAALAEARGARAVVLATHGRPGAVRLVGSVAAATLRRSPCPVLTLTSTAGERLVRPVRSALS